MDSREIKEKVQQNLNKNDSKILQGKPNYKGRKKTKVNPMNIYYAVDKHIYSTKTNAMSLEEIPFLMDSYKDPSF